MLRLLLVVLVLDLCLRRLSNSNFEPKVPSNRVTCFYERKRGTFARLHSIHLQRGAPLFTTPPQKPLA